MAAGKLSAQAVGTIVKIKESGTYAEFIVLAHNYPTSGKTLLLRKYLHSKRRMGPQDPDRFHNYYVNNELDTWLNSTYLNSLDSEIRDNLSLDTIKINEKTYTSIDRKIYLLSATELGTDDNAKFGTAIPYFDDDSSRVATLSDGTAYNYWSRTRNSSSQGYIYGITKSGAGKQSLNTPDSHGVRPAFSLPSSLYVTSNGAVVENTPPVISGSNGALGTFGDTPPSYKYTVTDAQGGTVSVTEKVDSTTLRTYNVTLGSQNTLTIPTATWKSLSNGSHTLTITAKDSHGATATRTQTFTKNATAPVISGSNGNLGSFGESGPTYQYTVTDAQGGTVTVAEKLDGAVLRTYTVTLGGQNTLSFTADAWRKILNGSHTLTITATDPLGLTATRTQTFTKNVTSCAFETAAAFPADAMPDRCIVNVQGEFPEGCTLKVEICNNGSDASPTWEDITQNALNNQKYFFTNKTKTASAWGVKLRATLSRGTASGECYISSLGGNFQ